MRDFRFFQGNASNFSDSKAIQKNFAALEAELASLGAKVRIVGMVHDEVRLEVDAPNEHLDKAWQLVDKHF